MVTSNTRHSRRLPRAGSSVQTSLVAILLAGATAFCSGAEAGRDGNPLQPTLPAQQAGTPVTVTSLASGSGMLTPNSGIAEPTRLVVRDAATWASTWSRIWNGQSSQPLPAVDFTRDMVIVAGLGTKPTGGYSIVVESASRDGAALLVVVRTESPGSSCLLSEALTAPVAAVRVPRTEGDVKFEEKSVNRQC